MNAKRIARALLRPHIAIMLVLLPISAVFLVYAMLFWETSSLPAIASYVLATYTLTVWCLKFPALIRFFRRFRGENKYAQRWTSDTQLRMTLSLYGTLIWNTAYAVFQLGLGLWHHTVWFYSLAGYYVALAIMRFFLVRHTRRHKPGEKMAEELRRYRACGVVFLAMNLALTAMIFFMVYRNRTFHHHEITTISMAAYTFTTLTLAIINVFRYRKYQSPVYSAAKAISLASACVSLLTLESTMLTTFGGETMTLTTRRIFLGASGGAISVFIIVMAIYMILQSSRKLKEFSAAEEIANG